ncbi:MAG TPA: hypothetical protein VFZ66_25750 [Herpetosiphonaceae bacterium]
MRLVRPQIHRPTLARSLAADLLLALSLTLLLIVGSTWSYRQRLAYALPIEHHDGLHRSGLGEAESSGNGWHRWSAPSTLIRFPGVGRAGYQVTLLFHNPSVDPPRTLTVGVGKHQLGAYALRPGWQQVSIALPAALIDGTSGDLDLTIRAEPPLDAGSRRLGIAVRGLWLEQLSAAQPPTNVQWSVALCLLLLVVPLRLLGTPTRWTGLGVGALLLLALLLLAWLRIDLLIALPLLNRTLPLSLIALPPLWLWLRRQDPRARPWARAVAVVALGLFVVRFVGMQHPQFVQIDHTLRVNQIKAMAGGGRARVQAQLSQQYEWGSDVVVPYSLLSYDLFVPLARWLSTPQLLAAVEGVTSALDASVVLLLWGIARRGGLDARSSWWAAALFAALPVGYLYFHDGSYPTIIGVWIMVVALWLLTRFADRPRWWLWAAATTTITLSILMYVTHLAFVPAVLGLAAASAWLWGVGRVRQVSRRIGLGAALGFALALLGYYGAQLPELIGRTIPNYIATLSQGGSVGRDASLLPGPLLGNVWQQLWGHYRAIVAALAALGVLLALHRRDRWLTHVTLAYGIFLILTAVADLRFGLWNKHMYFALPGVCLAAGPLLGQIQRRGRAGRALVFALFGYLLWTSLGAWLLRVAWYVWSLETL